MPWTSCERGPDEVAFGFMLPVGIDGRVADEVTFDPSDKATVVEGATKEVVLVPGTIIL